MKTTKAKKQTAAKQAPAIPEYQTWALDAKRELLHCGPRQLERIGPSVIRRLVREWEEWADTIAAKYPDCPTANSRRKTVWFAVAPVKDWKAVRWFDGRRGQEHARSN